jgi:glycosyltransferase involved in cell wall biosynthesis
MTEISVVIPTRNRLRFLQSAIPMYLRQRAVKEIVIVIDGSNDGTLEYLQEISKKDDRVIYVDNVTNRGTPYSRNKGINAARCEYIFTAEDDLEIADDFFSVLLAHKKATGADIIAPRNIFRFETDTREQAIRRADSLKGEAVDKHRIEIQTGVRIAEDQCQPLLASPMLARAEVFRAVEYDERYKVNCYREESDFQLSAQERGYKLVSCPHAISFNYMIPKDRSGAHAVAGIRWTRWSVTNNWRFIRKHQKFISDNFEIGNPPLYIIKFAARHLFTEVVLPFMVAAKRTVIRGNHRSVPLIPDV